MSAVPQELAETLSKLDSQSATALERLVRDAMALVRSTKREGTVDANGWPVGYFERTAGCFAGEPFDIPSDPPPEPTTDW